jgi:hypothetical protein
MDDETVIEHISYLEEDLTDPWATPSHDEFMKLMRAAIQLEMAKRVHWPNVDDMTKRVTTLEARLEAMRRFMATTSMIHPVVVYVPGVPSQVTDPVHVPVQKKFPKSLVVFYALGLVFSILFAILLALSALGINIVHPFLALLGFIGGIGWLTTAWTDLLSLKAEKSWFHATTAARLIHNGHDEVLPIQVKTGSR